MAGYFIIGTLAAFGAFCALWALIGLFLPRHTGTLVVVQSTPSQKEAALRRYRWLEGLGLVQGPVIFIDTWEDLTSLTEQERNGFDRA
jgi:hypothetical protein